MKIIGAILLCIGILGVLFVITLDTSVAVSVFGSSHRVHNIGLMNEKQNLLILFSAFSIIGGFLVAFSRNQPTHEDRLSESKKTDSQVRTCPYCAETIKEKAILCRYCGRDIEPIAREPEPIPDPDPDPPPSLSYYLLFILDKFLYPLEKFFSPPPPRPSESKTEFMGETIDLEKKWKKFIMIITFGIIRKK